MNEVEKRAGGSTWKDLTRVIVFVGGAAWLAFSSSNVSAQQAGDGGAIVIGPPSTSGQTTAGTTGTTTGTTTSGQTGGDVEGGDINSVFLRRVEEIKSAPSVITSSGGQTVTNRHVVRLKIMCPYSFSGDPQGEYTYSRVTYMGVQAPAEIGGDTLPSFFYNLGFWWVQAPSSSATWYFYPQLGSAAQLNGGTIVLKRKTETGGRYWDDNEMDWVYHQQETEGTATLDVAKLNLEGISLDPRRVFGKANLDGQLPGDPNADIGYNNFQPWIFKGGHFVGNMPEGSSNDQSGTGRTQLRYTGSMPSSVYIGSALAMFNMGQRSTVSSGVIGVYRPFLGTITPPVPPDPNLNVGLSAYWLTKWTLEPGQTPANDYDYTRKPFYSMNPQVVGVSQYVNWQLPYKKGAVGSPDYVNEMWKYVGLCQNNESLHTWNYFGSTWFSNDPINTGIFPNNDCHPRIWRVGQVIQ